MKELRFTLLSDGSSDQALLPLLRWLLSQYLPDHAFQSDWADLRQLTPRPKTLAERMMRSLQFYPCDLLFVHRDAEKEPWENRIIEIRSAREAVTRLQTFPIVCVVPVRMQEAWLLFDEAAIRQAAGNPNGKMTMKLPFLKTLEDLPDPKEDLYQLLREAKSLSRRRQRGERPSYDAQRVAGFIEDFSPLRVLPAFQALESEIVEIIQTQGW